MSGTQPNGQGLPTVIDEDQYQMNEQQLARMQATLDSWRAMNQNGHIRYQEKMRQLSQQIEAGEQAKQELALLMSGMGNARLSLPGPAPWAQINAQQPIASTSTARAQHMPHQPVETLPTTATIEEVPSPQYQRHAATSVNPYYATTFMPVPQNSRRQSHSNSSMSQAPVQGYMNPGTQRGQGYAPQRSFVPSGSNARAPPATESAFTSHLYAQPTANRSAQQHPHMQHAEQQSAPQNGHAGSNESAHRAPPPGVQVQSSAAGASQWSSLTGALGADPRQPQVGAPTSTATHSAPQDGTMSKPVPAKSSPAQVFHDSLSSARQQNNQTIHTTSASPVNGSQNHSTQDPPASDPNEMKKKATHSYLMAALAWSEKAPPNSYFDWAQFSSGSDPQHVRVKKDSSGKLSIVMRLTDGRFKEVDFQDTMRKLAMHEKAAARPANEAPVSSASAVPPSIPQTVVPAVAPPASARTAPQSAAPLQSSVVVPASTLFLPPPNKPVQPTTPPGPTALPASPFTPSQGTLSSLPRTPDKANKTSLAKDLLRALGRSSSLKELQRSKRPRSEDTEPDAGSAKRQAFGNGPTKESSTPSALGSALTTKAIPNTTVASQANDVAPPLPPSLAASSRTTTKSPPLATGPQASTSTALNQEASAPATAPSNVAESHSVAAPSQAARVSMSTTMNTVASALAVPASTSSIVHPPPPLGSARTGIQASAESNRGTVPSPIVPRVPPQAQAPPQPKSHYRPQAYLLPSSSKPNDSVPEQAGPSSAVRTSKPTIQALGKPAKNDTSRPVPPSLTQPGSSSVLATKASAAAVLESPQVAVASTSAPPAKEPLFLPSPSSSPPPRHFEQEEEESDDDVIVLPPKKLLGTSSSTGASRAQFLPRKKAKSRHGVLENRVLKSVLMPSPPAYVVADLKRLQARKDKGKGKAANVPVAEEEEEAEESVDSITRWHSESEVDELQDETLMYPVERRRSEARLSAGSRESSLFDANEVRETDALKEAAGRLRERPCRWKECEAVMNSGKDLVLHLQLHLRDGDAGEKPPLACRWGQCQQTFWDEEQIQLHLQGHALSPIYCAYEGCDETFRTAKHLVAHYEQEHITETAVLRPVTDPFKPEVASPPTAPDVLPSHMAVSRDIRPASISVERHQVLEPWVLRNIVGASSHRPARQEAHERLYDFVESGGRRAARMPALLDLPSGEVSRMAYDGMILWPGDDGVMTIEVPPAAQPPEEMKAEPLETVASPDANMDNAAVENNDVSLPAPSEAPAVAPPLPLSKSFRVIYMAAPDAQ